MLNPCYHLRNDVFRIVLFSKQQGDGFNVPEWSTFIHPLQAAMLSFFTHNRSLAQNVRLLADYFKKDEDFMIKKIIPFVNNKKVLYVTWRGQEILFPKNLIVAKDSIKYNFAFRNLAPDSFLCKQIDLFSRRFYSGPLLLTFMLNNKCTTNCVYCYADTKKNVKHPLRTKRIIELIEEAAGLQIQQINLIGGEIFLYPNWEIVMKELIKRKIAPEYISTKIPFTKILLSKLRDTGYKNLIQVSLDTIDNESLKRMVGVKNDIYRTVLLKGLKELDQSGFVFQVSSVITSYNTKLHYWIELYNFLSTLKNLNNWRIVPVNAPVHTNNLNFLTLRPEKSKVLTIFDYIEKNIKPIANFSILLGKEILENSLYTDIGGSACFKGSVCSALNTHMFILPDGKVTICEQLYWNPRFIIGDVTHSSLIDIWNSPKSLFLSNLQQQDIQETSECKKCNLFLQCYGYHNRCWSNVVKAYGNENWDYPDPRCCFAPKTQKKIGYFE